MSAWRPGKQIGVARGVARNSTFKSKLQKLSASLPIKDAEEADEEQYLQRRERIAGSNAAKRGKKIAANKNSQASREDLRVKKGNLK